MIVDMHTHLWSYPGHLTDEVAREMVAARLRRRRAAELGAGRPPPAESQPDLSTVNITPEKHWAHAQHADKTVVLALKAPQVGMNIPNEYVADYVRQHPERLVGFASVDPNDPEAPDELEHAITKLGLRGLKLGPCYQYFDPSDRRFFPLFERAQKLHLPVLFHMGATVLRRTPLRLSNPILLQDVALNFPDLRIIVAHMGHPWELETVVLMRQTPNVWADISTIHYRPWRFHNDLVAANEYGVIDRILFGTDFSASTTPHVLEGLRNVNELVRGTPLPKISSEVVDMIVGENWRAVLEP